MKIVFKLKTSQQKKWGWHFCKRQIQTYDQIPLKKISKFGIHKIDDCKSSLNFKIRHLVSP